MNKEKTYTEKELLYPALELIKKNGGEITTTKLIEELQDLLQPQGKDAEILFGRKDSRFSQKVRNLISHRTITQYADYIADKNLLIVNRKGLDYLNDDSNQLIKTEVFIDDENSFEGEESITEIRGDNHRIDMHNERVHIDAYNSSVFELKRKYDKAQSTDIAVNGLVLDESFQRTGLVWSLKQKSQLIESVLLGIPLPIFYLAEDKKNNLVVIDGRQRLTALFDFLDNKYKLTGLEFLIDLNGKNAMDLSSYKEQLIATIEDTYLYITKIKVSTPEFLKLLIFARVNKNGTPLNSQEMRHALHQGAVTDMLERLSDALDIGINKRRMKDRYLILRYISLRLYYQNELYNYKNDSKVEYTSIDEYLGFSMDAINTFTEEQIMLIESEFTDTYKKTIEIFGANAFRLEAGNPINMIMFEITLLLVSLLKNYCTNKEIQNSLSEYMCKGEDMVDFYNNIKFHRDSKDNFNERINWVSKIAEWRKYD